MSLQPESAMSYRLLHGLWLYLWVVAPVLGAQMPDPEDAAYLRVSEFVNDTAISFNHAQRHTRSIMIQAKTLRLDPSTTKNDLFARLHEQPDISQLTIYAETLILAHRLRLPQTDLLIYTHRLVFEDPPQGDPSVWDTTPLSLIDRPSQGEDGAEGLKAGRIRLYVDSMDPPDLVGLRRFVLRGGDGQPAGLGRDGQDSASMQDEVEDCIDKADNLPRVQELPDGAVYLYWMYGTTEVRVAGSKAWPGDGENAVAAGRPGSPGAGGIWRRRS